MAAVVILLAIAGKAVAGKGNALVEAEDCVLGNAPFAIDMIVSRETFTVITLSI